ncbi:hypothetical protein B0H10DRAFT_1998172 [Mycena sp. CBHHK59/15]|nr:hypothetical protein B0H10DRAFT_1998172 [Mycena sp. CBHHK59/15]
MTTGSNAAPTIAEPGQDGSASPAGTPPASESKSTTNSAKDHLPKSVVSHFSGVPAPPDTGSLRASRFSLVHRDSTDSGVTNLSTQAQAGSLVSSGSASPALTPSTSDSSESEFSQSDSRSDLGPFRVDAYDGAELSTPPQLKLEPRTYPLAAGSATHGGVALCEEEQRKLDTERAEGVRSPAYDQIPATPHSEVNTNEYADNLDDSNPDESGLKKAGRCVMAHLHGEAKVLSGRMMRDSDKVEEGKKIMGRT